MQGQIESTREHMKTGISLLEEYELLYTNDSISQISNYTALLTETQEPELIETKYQKIQKLYPRVGFSIVKRLSDFFSKINIILGVSQNHQIR